MFHKIPYQYDLYSSWRYKSPGWDSLTQTICTPYIFPLSICFIFMFAFHLGFQLFEDEFYFFIFGQCIAY